LRTGRNVQLNVKATAETISRFTALAQQTKLPQGELLRRALDAYEEKMTDRNAWIRCVRNML
jgi:predicted DNA-binding protein